MKKLVHYFESEKGKRLKNTLVCFGAAVVLAGALFKIMHWPAAGAMLTAGMLTEVFLFTMFGVLPPHKDYYWEKLYPGIEDYHADVPAILPGVGAIDGNAKKPSRALNAEVVEDKLGGMLSELQGMSKSMSSLKALQEIN